MTEPLSMLPIPLLQWYQENARDLPWRREPTPYRVWVSEIMLQQTRVGAVLGYFARFMAALPTVQDLAAVPEDALMKLWQGLGYYSRARNLQKAARQIVEDHGGVFPTDYKDIRALAGVGDYTAAAISSICFGQPVPAVDGNLLRVAARVMGDATDITTTQGKRHFTAALQEVIPLDTPGQFNQAMMDLGATVCLPNGAPQCARCPAADFCQANAQDRTRELPVRPAKKPRRVEERVVFLLFHEGKVALRRRPAKGLLAGLWEYPNELAPAEEARTRWGLPGEGTFVGTGKHIFTHVEWRLTARRWDLSAPVLPEGWVWADRRALERDYPIPSAFASVQQAVEEGVGMTKLSYDPTHCTLCPRRCGGDRTRAGGRCRMPEEPVVARAALHYWEEPPLSGTRGAGTVFFSGCSLGCVFCQNEAISQKDFGRAISVRRLREIFWELIDAGAHNIDLVNPTHYAHVVAQALEEPLPVPVVWNSGGYDRVETLQALEGKIQIYLPDFKYPDAQGAADYAGAADYPAVAQAAIREMVRQTGPYQLDEHGLLRRGVILRHLLLPGRLAQAKQVMDWAAETFPPHTLLFSLMSQYTPWGRAADLPPLDRRLRKSEVRGAMAYLENLPLDGFTQGEEAASADYIPSFDLTGVEAR